MSNAIEFVGAPNNRSISDDGEYVVSVKEASLDYYAFSKFKQDPRYTRVLEHTTEQQGAEYLNIIATESPEFISMIDKFRENDLIGSPSLANYAGIGKISPSTLRYIKVVSDLKQLFGQNIGNRVAEIGGGYGGQLLIADKTLAFKQWDIFDLPPVMQLISRYLEAHILNSSYRCISINQHPGDIRYDLVISNYAFSELPSSLQKVFIKKVLKMSKAGYLTMNSGLQNSAFQNDKLSLDELRELLPTFRIIEERPKTHPGNYVLVWSETNGLIF